MNPLRKNIIENNLEKIAESEGVSVEEVRNEISLSISYALKSDDPKVLHFWKSIPCEGESPTVDEVVYYFATQFVNKN